MGVQNPRKETPGKAPTSSNPFQVLGKNDLGKEDTGEDVMAKAQEVETEMITSWIELNKKIDAME